jgi:hypothetical protein
MRLLLGVSIFIKDYLLCSFPLETPSLNFLFTNLIYEFNLLFFYSGYSSNASFNSIAIFKIWLKFYFLFEMHWSKNQFLNSISFTNCQLNDQLGIYLPKLEYTSLRLFTFLLDVFNEFGVLTSLNYQDLNIKSVSIKCLAFRFLDYV